MCISSFLQEEKTKVFYKHASGLIKPIMSAHFHGFDHSPGQNTGKQVLMSQMRD